MECVLAREDIELMVKNRFEADITHLGGVDGDVLMLLLTLLLTELLGRRRVDFKLLLQQLNLFMVLLQALTKVVFHVLHLLIGRE